jgi:hypothetical protein
MERVEHTYSDSWRALHEATAGLGEVIDRANSFTEDIVGATGQQAVGTTCGPREYICTTDLATRILR